MSPRIVIYVDGGVVTACVSNDPLLEVRLIDYDGLSEEGKDPDEEEARLLSEFADCVHAVF